MDIITQEQAFNMNFYEYCLSKKIELSETNYLQTLIVYCAKENYIDYDTVEQLNIVIQESITDFILEDMKKKDAPAMFDMGTLYSKYSPKYLNIVNRYFMTIDNPYKTVESLTNDDFTDTIKNGIKNDEIIINRLLEKYYTLLKMTPLLYKLHKNYNAMMNTIRRSILTMSYVDDSLFSYRTLDGEDSLNLSSYQDIDKYLGKLIVEAKILNRFNKASLERILRRINLISKTYSDNINILTGREIEYEDYSNDLDDISDDEIGVIDENFCRVVLSNYFLNVILLNTHNLRLSDIAINTIYIDIDTITKEEIINVVNKRFSDLSDYEREYIINNFTRNIEANKTTIIKN